MQFPSLNHLRRLLASLGCWWVMSRSTAFKLQLKDLRLRHGGAESGWLLRTHSSHFSATQVMQPFFSKLVCTHSLLKMS